MTTKACLALGHSGSWSKHKRNVLVGASCIEALALPHSFTPVHCTGNAFQFSLHPTFHAFISSVCFHKGIVLLIFAELQEKAAPSFIPALFSVQAGARSLTGCSKTPPPHICSKLMCKGYSPVPGWLHFMLVLSRQKKRSLFSLKDSARVTSMTQPGQ